MRREFLADHRAHREFGGPVRGRHGVERAATAFVLDAQGGAEERLDRVAGHGREFVDERTKVYRRHPASGC